MLFSEMAGGRPLAGAGEMMFGKARATISGGGWKVGGAAIRSSKLSLEAAQSQEIGILQAPSPTKVTTFRATDPSFSSMVWRSAMIWQGCSSSVRALMVGMPEYWAKSWTSLWAKVRMTAP